MQQRIKVLDLLRGLAVAGVLFRHAHLDNFITQAGWAGVDLFFVLSGYLVSRLLFLEYNHTQQIKLGRFLLRRGFKIYPVFYLLIVVTVLVNYFTSAPIAQSKLLSEIFFVQSYFKGLWNHTWSLAVEEHFYFLLALCVFLFRRSNFSSAKTLYVLLFLWFLFCAFRWSYAWNHSDETEIYFTDTHLRIDGLLLGVIISWLTVFSSRARAFFTQYANVLLLVSLPLLAPLWIWKGGDFEMNSFGLSFISLGFATLLAALLHKDYYALAIRFRIVSTLLNTLAFIGVFSYSLYVWHLPVLHYTDKMMLSGYTSFVVYIAMSIVAGYISFHFIEQPIVLLRDKITNK
jgi:peptidoglycan/LPS O-acetylase OafA/YrhL